uniref:Ubiquitin carboxyl-terminal hydrolase 7 n=1 Tax=Ascaris suum TaxID=6253 RepID=F1KSR2_ASCSU
MEESAPGEELEAAIPSMEKMEEDESVGSEVDFGDTFAEFGDHITSDHDGSVDSHSMQPAAGPIIVEAVEGDVDDPYKSEATLCLDIQKFSEFSCCYPTAHRVLGNYVYARGLPWRILATVKERASSDGTYDLGFFVQCGGDPRSATSWSCAADVALKVRAQKEGVKDAVKRFRHTFHRQEDDWGFAQYMPCEVLTNPNNGLIKDDTIKLEVTITADAPHGVQWDSKKHTGFVGLKNQGATCYLNSILQTFFFTNMLRKAVYEMPTENDDTETSVALAMQRVFYELQMSDKPVGTRELTESFGWDSVESFRQHDVQELSRVLLDKLEREMAGTKVKDAIPSLFGGKMKSYIRCTNVPFESSREESFYDLQLSIKGRTNLIASLDSYTAKETLDGDNKYDAGEFGLQPAEKGVKFISFPPVLHLQLLRFQYDVEKDANVKINDRFEFPALLDLSEFVDDGDKKTPIEFLLQAVLVHTGNLDGGHYVVFINTNMCGPPRWCKFDDEVVSSVSEWDAIDANYGGSDVELQRKPFTSAYMLVYVQKSRLNEILREVTRDDIPQHLRFRFEKEEQRCAKRRKDKKDAQPFVELLVVLEEHMFGYNGFDLLDPKILDDIPRLEVEKKMSIADLYALFAKEFHVQENAFRLWRVQERIIDDGYSKNFSLARLRPCNLLKREGRENAAKTVEDIFGCEGNIVFMEVASDSGQSLCLPEYNDLRDLMFFLKYYDVDLQQTIFCGHIMISCDSSVSEHLPEILKRAHLPAGTNLNFYEEVCVGRCNPLCVNERLSENRTLGELIDSAILVFERSDKSDPMNNALSYYTRLFSTISVEVVQKPDPFGTRLLERFASLESEMSLNWSVAELTQWIAGEINLAVDRILLWKMRPYSNKLSDEYLNEEEMLTYSLKDLLGLRGSRHHDPRIRKRYRIFYTVMPFPVLDLQRRYIMQLHCMDENMQISKITVFPHRDGDVRSILCEARQQFRFSENGTNILRLLCIGHVLHRPRVYYVFRDDLSVAELLAKINSSNHALQARVEEVPEEELIVGDGECLLPVAHFDKDPSSTFGVPFFVKVIDGESFEGVSERIRRKLGVSEQDFSKYKLAIIVNNCVRGYPDKQSAVSLNELAQTHLSETVTAPWLGLDHTDKARGTGGTHTIERAIVIRN